MDSEKIKKGLYACGNCDTVGCNECPYFKTKDCQSEMELEALALINEQEKEIQTEWKDRRKAEEDLMRVQHNYKIGLSQSQNRNKKIKEEKEALKKQVEYWEDQTKVAREETDNAVKEIKEQIFNDVLNACKKRFDETKGYTCKGDIEFVLAELAERYGVKIKVWE